MSLWLAVVNIVALAAANDARAVIAIGAGGETYALDATAHAWKRTAGGGISGTIASLCGGDAPIAGVASGPPYELVHAGGGQAGGWSALNTGAQVAALLGRGARCTAAVGKAVYALEHGAVTKLADAPANVVALAASSAQVAVETERGIARWDGKKWTPLAKAPRHVLALLDPHRGLVDRGVVDLDTGVVTAWPAGFQPAASAVVAVDDVIYAAHGQTLVTVKRGAIAREPIGVALASPVVAIAADPRGRIAVATARQLAIRGAANSWTAAEISDELPPPHPGAPPAVSQ